MDVLVVGCGASGVAALRALHDGGLKVLGLEAAGRVGGRIRTEPFGGSVVDMGAQWCHGEKDNAVFELAREQAVLGRPAAELRAFLSSDGRPLAAAVDFVAGLDSLLRDADKQNETSIPEYLRDAIKKKAITLQDSKLVHPVLEWFERFNHVGGQDCPTRAKSLRGLSECWPCEGEFMLNWKDRGYQTLLDLLLNGYPNPEDRIPVEILLNKEVESIKWKGTKPGVDTASPLVQVTCKDGSLYAAKCVILTMSIGVLQERHQKMFSPALPAEKINAISNLQMSVLDKIYIQFRQPWWSKSPCYFALVWRPEEKAKLSADESWVSEIYALSTVEYQPNLLCAWICGEGAKAMEKAKLDAVRHGVSKVLSLFFENDSSEIVDIKRSQWASDPLTRGAYAYRCVDTEARGGGAAALAEPLYYDRTAPKVCFAGEATSLHHHGAVHGAVEAGLREARRIIDYINK